MPKKNKMESSLVWEGYLENTIAEALAILDERGADWIGARRAAVEALVNVAAGFWVHHVNAISPDGEENPIAVDEAVKDFANQARVALMGELTLYGLIETA
jgi:hypothetical protein